MLSGNLPIIELKSCRFNYPARSLQLGLHVLLIPHAIK